MGNRVLSGFIGFKLNPETRIRLFFGAKEKQTDFSAGWFGWSGEFGPFSTVV
jgi:hypothetical protein